MLSHLPQDFKAVGGGGAFSPAVVLPHSTGGFQAPTGPSVDYFHRLSGGVQRDLQMLRGELRPQFHEADAQIHQFPQEPQEHHLQHAEQNQNDHSRPWMSRYAYDEAPHHRNWTSEAAK